MTLIKVSEVRTAKWFLSDTSWVVLKSFLFERVPLKDFLLVLVLLLFVEAVVAAVCLNVSSIEDWLENGLTNELVVPDVGDELLMPESLKDDDVFEFIVDELFVDEAVVCAP